jgi:HemY protein
MFGLLIGIVIFASNNFGYVLIVRPPYRLQFSFNFLLVLMVLGFLAIHYILRFFYAAYLLTDAANLKRNA